jgi:hypothetical protein
MPNRDHESNFARQMGTHRILLVPVMSSHCNACPAGAAQRAAADRPARARRLGQRRGLCAVLYHAAPEHPRPVACFSGAPGLRSHRYFKGRREGGEHLASTRTDIVKADVKEVSTWPPLAPTL